MHDFCLGEVCPKDSVMKIIKGDVQELSYQPGAGMLPQILVLVLATAHFISQNAACFPVFDRVAWARIISAVGQNDN